MSATPDPDRSVCPRCGGDAAEFRFCPVCALDLVSEPQLPTRAEWERERAAQPWPARAQSEGVPEVSPESRSGSRRTPRSRRRSAIEVGGPLLVVGALAFVLLRPTGGSPVSGGLHYDSRAAPLLASLRASRERSLRRSTCHGCADVSSDGGGCSGYLSDWTCDVMVVLHRRDPQIQEAQLPASQTVLETYKVTWQRNGCWQASEDCISDVGSAGNVCPPPVVAFLDGCIHSG